MYIFNERVDIRKTRHKSGDRHIIRSLPPKLEELKLVGTCEALGLKL